MAARPDVPIDLSGAPRGDQSPSHARPLPDRPRCRNRKCTGAEAGSCGLPQGLVRAARSSPVHSSADRRDCRGLLSSCCEGNGPIGGRRRGGEYREAFQPWHRCRRHVHGHRRLRHDHRTAGKPQGAHHARRPIARRDGRHRPAAGRQRHSPLGHRSRRARDDALLQRRDRAQGRQDRPDHDPGLPRHARDRPRAQVRALRHQYRQAGRARAAAPATGGARAHRRRRQRASAAGPDCGARGRGKAGGGGRRLARGGLPALLRQHQSRATGARADRRAFPQAQPVGLDRCGAGDPRIRARLDDRDQRLHQAARRALPGHPRGRDRRSGDRRAAAADAVERRTYQHRGGQAHARAAAGIGARRRRPRCRPARERRWRRPRAGLRHGRHHGQAQRHRRRQADGRLQLRGGPRAPLHRGQRAARAHLHAGADRDRGRRRLDRQARRHRPPEGGPRERGLRAGPRRLRPRRRATHRHRRRPVARLSRSQVFRRRHHGHRHASGRGGHAPARAACRALRHRARLGHP